MTVDRKRTYFDSWAQDYQSAEKGFSGHGSLVQRTINRLFRIKTFALSNAHINDVLRDIDLDGKRVLDAGCGPGAQVFFCAARGADVTGFDISPSMIDLCWERAEQEAADKNIQFVVCDLIDQPLEQYDVVLSIGVLEYYKPVDELLEKLCVAADRSLLVCLPRRILWRFVLRKILGVVKGFDVFYHDSERIKTLAANSGMRCVGEWEIHSFHTLLFSSAAACGEEKE
jgi:SAM-dependent methyltransferase